MAHYVGKTLNIRPNEILDTWGVPELIVAFGQYANEVAMQNYETWKSTRRPGDMSERPTKRIIWFMGKLDG